MKLKIWLVIVSFSLPFMQDNLNAQLKINDDYLIVNAEGNDPLFTTYAAAIERSRFFADKAYFSDTAVLECPSNYIWDSIMAKVLIDIYCD